MSHAFSYLCDALVRFSWSIKITSVQVVNNFEKNSTLFDQNKFLYQLFSYRYNISQKWGSLKFCSLDFYLHKCPTIWLSDRKSTHCVFTFVGWCCWAAKHGDWFHQWYGLSVYLLRQSQWMWCTNPSANPLDGKPESTQQFVWNILQILQLIISKL